MWRVSAGREVEEAMASEATGEQGSEQHEERRRRVRSDRGHMALAEGGDEERKKEREEREG